MQTINAQLQKFKTNNRVVFHYHLHNTFACTVFTQTLLSFLPHYFNTYSTKLKQPNTRSSLLRLQYHAHSTNTDVLVTNRAISQKHW